MEVAPTAGMRHFCGTQTTPLRSKTFTSVEEASTPGGGIPYYLLSAKIMAGMFEGKGVPLDYISEIILTI